MRSSSRRVPPSAPSTWCAGRLRTSSHGCPETRSRATSRVGRGWRWRDAASGCCSTVPRRTFPGGARRIAGLRQAGGAERDRRPPPPLSRCFPAPGVRRPRRFVVTARGPGAHRTLASPGVRHRPAAPHIPHPDPPGSSRPAAAGLAAGNQTSFSEAARSCQEPRRSLSFVSRPSWLGPFCAAPSLERVGRSGTQQDALRSTLRTPDDRYPYPRIAVTSLRPECPSLCASQTGWSLRRLAVSPRGSSPFSSRS